MWPLDQLFNYLYYIVHLLLARVPLAPNRPVGWISLDRKTGTIERERQPIYKKVKLLLIFNPLTEWLDTTQAMRLHAYKESATAGRVEGSPDSKKHIKSVVDSYERPIYEPENPFAAIAVADSRVVTYASFPEAQKLWIKGKDFSIARLIMDRQLARTFSDGSLASFWLWPQDCHRYYSPVSGIVKRYRSMPGDDYEVDPVALHSGVDILTRNRRDYVVIKSEQFGYVLVVAIGATGVGMAQIHEKWQKTGSFIKKGDELGMFESGDSCIVVVFQRGMMHFDQDLLNSSKDQVQVSVDVGMSLGRAPSFAGIAK